MMSGIDNEVTHRKIFTLSKLLAIFYALKYGEFITYYRLEVDFKVLVELTFQILISKYFNALSD